MKNAHLIDTPCAILDRRRFALALPLLAAGAASPQDALAAKASPGDKAPIATHHRTKTIDGMNIFYREAGPAVGARDGSSWPRHASRGWTAGSRPL